MIQSEIAFYAIVVTWTIFVNHVCKNKQLHSFDAGRQSLHEVRQWLSLGSLEKLYLFSNVI